MSYASRFWLAVVRGRRKKTLVSSKKTISFSAQEECGVFLETKDTLQAVNCYIGAYIQDDPITKGDIGIFENLTEKSHALYGYQIYLGQPFPMQWLLETYIHEKIPLFTVLPSDYFYPFQEEEIVKLAEEMGKMNVEMFLALFPSPADWCNDPERYVAFYRRAYEIFLEKAPNVQLIWSSAVTDPTAAMAYYPGDRYVDWIGVEYYVPAGEKELDLSGLDYFYYSFQQKKPMMITKLGVSHYTTKSHEYFSQEAGRLVTEFYEKIEKEYPAIKAVLYYNLGQQEEGPAQMVRQNYGVTADETMLYAYRKGIDTPYFSGYQTSLKAMKEESLYQKWKCPYRAYYKDGILYLNENAAGYMEQFGQIEQEGQILWQGRNYMMFQGTFRFDEDSNQAVISMTA